MNFNLEKNGAYKYIAFIVVSFALGFYTNVVIGNFWMTILRSFHVTLLTRNV